MHSRTTHRVRSVWAGLVVAALGSAALLSAQPYATPISPVSPLGEPQVRKAFEASVLAEIHATNQYEIQAGELARRKGQSEPVRRYGDLLARDHRFLDTQLLSLARQDGISMNEQAPFTDEQRRALLRQHLVIWQLGRDNDDEFDRDFIHVMQHGVAATVERLNDLGQTLGGSHPGRYISRILPIMRQHEALALHLEERG